MISIKQSIRRLPLAVLSLACACIGARAEDSKVTFSAAAWSQYGQIANSSPADGVSPSIS